jgi:rRNA maturation endonuclease Nob1
MSGWRKRTIMEMAKEAGFELDCTSLEWHKRIEAFAKLVREDERNFCPRCGKRTRDLTTIHTCTPPQE